MSEAQRFERDLLGERAIPADAYYGVHTLRAVENFPISGTAISVYPDLINALAAVKQAAALANNRLGLLDAVKTDAIVKACEDVRAGQFHDQFVVDVIQGGAGTSTNMNANEVIANRALEYLGHQLGEYQHLDPLEHVNMSQSTNDVCPTAMKVAFHVAIGRLRGAAEELRSAFAQKAEEFGDILKIGRTQMQDAVPMTLGQEFGAYAEMIADDLYRLEEAATILHEVNLGGTAIGTGINTSPQYARLACESLAEITSIPVRPARNMVASTQDASSFVHLSGALRRMAVKLSKISNDLRLLSSGPQAGFGEIQLPPMQAGSSIMPGKVNPVIPEVVNQVAFQVIGNDVTITMAAEAGQLQLNAFLPIIAHSLFQSIEHLRTACLTLTERCVVDIVANRDHLKRSLERSVGIVTALNPYIGYKNATAVAKEALATGQSVRELVQAKGLLTKEQLDDLLQPEVLTKPRDVRR